MIKFKQTFICANLLGLSACSQDVSDLQSFIAQTKSAHVGSVKPIPQFKPYESFSYSAADLRDPFVSTADLEEDDGTKTSNNTGVVHPNIFGQAYYARRVVDRMCESDEPFLCK